MSEEKEIWKPLKGFEGLYEISTHGRVKSLNYNNTRKPGIMKDYDNNYGYRWIALRKNGKTHEITIHRLMGETFLDLDRSNKKLVINHKDLDKKNNRLENLEIISPRANRHHYVKTLEKTSKYVGVYFNQRENKWRAHLKYKGRNIHLGYFEDEDEAGAFVQDVRFKLTGHR